MLKRLKFKTPKRLQDNRGFLSAIAAIGKAALPSIAKAAGSAAIGKFLGGKSKAASFDLPEYQKVEEFDEVQELLLDLGKDTLEGNFPEAFKSLAETGSEEFEQFLALTNKEIGNNALEAAAITGVGRSPATVNRINKAVAENNTKSRYADFLRAQGGKEMFLNYGTKLLDSVRSAASTRESNLNNFNLRVGGMEADLLQQEREDDLILGEAAGDIAGSVYDSVKESGIFQKAKTKVNNTVSKFGKPTLAY